MLVIEKFQKVIQLIQFRYRKLRIQLRKKPVIHIDRKIPLISLGTHYGGWKIPDGFLNEESICYFAGGGCGQSF